MNSTTKWVLGVAASAAVGVGTCASTRLYAVSADYSVHKVSNAADVARLDEGQRDTQRRLERIETKLDRALAPCQDR